MKRSVTMPEADGACGVAASTPNQPSHILIIFCLWPKAPLGAKRREDLADGLRLEFAPAAETIALIARVVEAERHCWRFLRFGMTVEPDGGPVFCELTGPAGTREFVGALIEA